MNNRIPESTVEIFRVERTKWLKIFRSLTDQLTMHTHPDGSTPEHYGLRAPKIDDAKGRVRAYDTIVTRTEYRTPDEIAAFIAEQLVFCNAVLAEDNPEKEAHFILAYRDAYLHCAHVLSDEYSRLTNNHSCNILSNR